MNPPRPNPSERPAYIEFGRHPSPAAEGAAEKPPAQQNLRVEVSRKGRKGKTVTVISGFQTTPATLALLVKQLKAHCGAGGAVKDNTLEIQGDQGEKALALLKGLGYNAKRSGG